MTTLGKVKVGLSIFGLVLSLFTINAMSIHSTGAVQRAERGDLVKAEQSKQFLYINLALTVVLVGASLKTLLDKSTYDS